MKDGLFIMFLALVLLVLFFVMGYKEGGENSLQEIINECQQKLPRDQYCTIIAVPENELDSLED